MARQRFPERAFCCTATGRPCGAPRTRPLLAAREIEHTPERVDADARPSHVLRPGRGTSMGLAIEAVRSGRASAMVSAGNTGA